MKIIGVLGGMSAASTQTYYRELCTRTRERLGGLHSPELLIRSLYFAVIEALQAAGDWKQAGAILNREAKALERGGAEFIILATNTMHKLAAEMMHGVSIPLLHIADATARSIKAKGLRSPGLMATRFTMEETFYTERLIAAGLAPIVPEDADRTETHRIIYEELCRDIVRAESEAAYIDIAGRLVGARSRLLDSWLHGGRHATQSEQCAGARIRHNACALRCRADLCPFRTERRVDPSPCPL